MIYLSVNDDLFTRNIHCNDKKLSAMIGGNRKFEIVYYKNVDKLIDVLSEMGL